jgi:hypothetical protein
MIGGFGYGMVAYAGGSTPSVATVEPFYTGGYRYGVFKRRKIEPASDTTAEVPINKAKLFPDMYSRDIGDIAGMLRSGEAILRARNKPNHPFTDEDAELYASAALIILEMHYNNVNQWPMRVNMSANAG